MNGIIKFYHPDETFIYHIKKSFCKVVFQNKVHVLVIEITSTDELDHIEVDSLQNEYPEVIFNIEDFIIPFQSIEELVGNTINITFSYEGIEKEDGEIDEFYYTNLNVNDEEDLETDENNLHFSKDEKGNLVLIWKGVCDDFTFTTDEQIKFKVACTFNESTDEVGE